MHTDHLREKAVALRGQGFTIDEIASSVNVPRGTVYGWVGSIPIPRTEKQKKALWRTGRDKSRKWAVKRQAAYDSAAAQAETLLADPDTRDFVSVYLCEGTRVCRNRVEVTNSNPAVIALAARVMVARSKRQVSCRVHAYDDHDTTELQKFWMTVCRMSEKHVVCRVKGSGGRLKGRDKACRHGVCQVRTSDTYFRSWLQALMDYVQTQWTTGHSSGVERSAWDREAGGAIPLALT